VRAGQFRIVSRKGAMAAKGNSILNLVIFVSSLEKILLKNPVANFGLIGGCRSASEKFHRCLPWL